MSYEEDEEFISPLPEHTVARIQWFYGQLDYQRRHHESEKDQIMMAQLMAIYQEVFREIIYTKEFE